MKLECVEVLLLFSLAVTQIYGRSQQFSKDLPSLRKLPGLARPHHLDTKFPKLGAVWMDCSKPGDKAKIDKVVIKPDPPTQGALSVVANFTLSEEVSGGKVSINITIDGFNILNQDMDLCGGVAPAINLQCPLKPGPQMASIDTDLSGVPPGHITGTQYLYDEDDKELACVELNLKL